MKIQLLLLLLLLSKTTFSQTILTGKVTDRDNLEELIGATVRITRGGEVVKGAITGFDYKYQIVINPGVYGVQVSYTGYKSAKIDSVQVLKGQINRLDITMEIDSTYNPNHPTNYYIEGIRVLTDDNPSPHLKTDQIKNLPSRPAQPIVSDSIQTQSPPPQPPTKKKRKPRQPSTGNKK